MIPSAAVPRPATMGLPLMNERMNIARVGVLIRERTAESASRSLDTDALQAFSLAFGAGRCCNDLDFFDYAIAIEMVGNADKGNRCGLKDGHRLLRSGAVCSQDQGRPQTNDAFRGQLPEISYIRLRTKGVRRIQTRGVDGDHPCALTERIEDLGHGAADRNHA